jgi:hypothetical protein
MMLSTELIALAEARREAFEKEIRLQNQLAQCPPQPARWQLWTGSGMMWAGAKLVNWGEGIAANGSRQIEVSN